MESELFFTLLLGFSLVAVFAFASSRKPAGKRSNNKPEAKPQAPASQSTQATPAPPSSKFKFTPPMTSDSPNPLPPAGDKQFSASELSQFNGSDPSRPVYLAVKGTVFDVTQNRGMYEPGQGYSVFAGKDASKALGKSSLKPEDCVADFSSLNAEEMQTLDKWHAHYQKKYPIVGRVV
ncbi:hypothetical protein HDU67_008262 [Dinochytrium kinnereticum]|nr:hypothetical protein HDU67_008262 [Dinochytrium kinnereticum]